MRFISEWILRAWNAFENGYKEKYRPWLKDHRMTLQTHGAVFSSFSVVIAIIAFTLSIKSYKEAQVLEQENSIRDAMQISLMEKYTRNTDSILKQISIQAEIAKEQYKAQIELNRPVISFYKFSGHDSINYPSFKWKGKCKWRAPYFKHDYMNYGIRPANSLQIRTTCFCLGSGIISDGTEDSFTHSINANRSEYYFHVPFIPENDSQKFYMRHILTWGEKNLNKTEVDSIYLTCKLMVSGKYKITYMHDELKEKLNLMEKDSSRIVKFGYKSALLSNTIYAMQRKKIYGF